MEEILGFWGILCDVRISALNLSRGITRGGGRPGGALITTNSNLYIVL